ncbi:MAG: radical SAM protein [Candidatus Orphnella occulta]|nr:radical SAM protein [Candidatus Orphnella occulta]
MYISIKNFLKLGFYWAFNCLLKLPFSFHVMPLNLTLSITNRCVARCKTCNIWRTYLDSPDLIKKELTSDEWVKILKSIGTSPSWITISGGNQFLRDDLVLIIKHAVEYCRPAVINIPVSGVMPEVIYEKTEELLKICKAGNIKLIINISLDGLGEKQDYMRGLKGDFEKTLKTYKKLIELKERYANFYLGIYTVVSAFNVNDVPDICDFVKKELKPDAYAIEIAEQRKELVNLSDAVMPPVKDYRDAVSYYFKRFSEKSRGILYLKQLIRRRYYYLISEGIVIPCRAGIVSAQISPYGDVWPCCTRAEVMGNLKEGKYDFKKIWFSKKADIIRKEIDLKQCSCTHCNPHYTNILFHPKSLMAVCVDFLRSNIAK